jgi:uncharacterized membrane protein
MTFFGIVLALWAILLVPPLRGMRRLGTARDRARYAIGVAFVFGGAMHFVAPARYLPMMPPWLPWHLGLVYLSGLLEILGGIGLFIPRVARAATFGLVLLLIAVFPANLQAALTGSQAVGMPSAPWYLWLRLPFQAVFIAWLLVAMPRRDEVSAGPTTPLTIPHHPRSRSV